MNKVEFNGSVYESDGENIYKDGVLLDVKVPQKYHQLENVTAMKVDEYLYYNGEFYSKDK